MSEKEPSDEALAAGLYKRLDLFASSWENLNPLEKKRWEAAVREMRGKNAQASIEEAPSDMERMIEVVRTATRRARTYDSYQRHLRELCVEIVHLLGYKDPEVREIVEELAVTARSTMQVNRMGEVSVRHAINDPTIDALLSAEAKAFRRILDGRDLARQTMKNGRTP